MAQFIRGHNINWTKLHAIAAVHGIKPLLHHIIEQDKIETGSSFSALARKDYQQSVLRNMKLAVVTGNILRGLEAEQITVVPYKGVTLANDYYNDIGERQSTDIDFLAASEDVPRIEAYFKVKGYIPKVTVPAGYLKFYQSFFKEIVYRTPENMEGGDVSVEIHRPLVDRFSGRTLIIGFSGQDSSLST